nr:MAG TPA: hypothetical protein [Caudoviricetes sp.]
MRTVKFFYTHYTHFIKRCPNWTPEYSKAELLPAPLL